MDGAEVDRAQPNAALLAAEPGTISAQGPVWEPVNQRQASPLSWKRRNATNVGCR